MSNPYRDRSDAELLAECRVEVRRDSGPGGQHRNKVESAIRLVHEPPALVVTASERRSQHANRTLALERLRARLERHFHRDAPRVPTRKSRAVRSRELDAKRRTSVRKKLRRSPPEGD